MNVLIVASLLQFLAWIIPLLLLSFFYFFVIYIPEKKQRSLLLKLALGKKIVTHSGLYGTLIAIEKEECVIALENNAHARISKDSIRTVQ